jgi:hypothetical protein
MNSYVVITHKNRVSTRLTEYHRTLSALKRHYTLALKDKLDKVEILDGSALTIITWTRYRGDSKWTLSVTERVSDERDPT